MVDTQRAFVDPVAIANAVTRLTMPTNDHVTGHDCPIDGGPVPTVDLQTDRETAVRAG